jgi:hypothetical protein
MSQKGDRTQKYNHRAIALSSNQIPGQKCDRIKKHGIQGYSLKSSH